MVRKQSDTVHLKLRFSEKLRLRIEAAADRNQRSMNSEIVHRLEQSFEKDDRMADIKAAAMATATAMVEKFPIVGGPKVRTKK
jgi:Arc-like DNA binding domain